MKPRITLEQWQALLAVVDAGGYAQAAEQLNKSQSAVSYAIQKMENVLSLQIFELAGRKAVLTHAGDALYRRAQALVDEAAQTEQLAQQLAKGMEAEIRLAIDTITPDKLVLTALATFAEEAPLIRVQLVETVLSGSEKAILEHKADLVLTGIYPSGYLTTPLLQLEFAAVAHPDHPLHQLSRELTPADLRRHRQLVVRDSGPRDMDTGWLKADQRWTFSSMDASIRAACQGLGYAWYPLLKIQQALQQQQLKTLPISQGSVRNVQLSMILPRGEFCGPGTQRLADILQQTAQVMSEGA